MIKDSKQHLIDANETYLQHFNAALKIGFTMIFGGFQRLYMLLFQGS